MLMDYPSTGSQAQPVRIWSWVSAQKSIFLELLEAHMALAEVLYGWEDFYLPLFKKIDLQKNLNMEPRFWSSGL